jgi:LDH2 family malate/lactate/ureidoglycolate dehydrogenase
MTSTPAKLIVTYRALLHHCEMRLERAGLSASAATLAAAWLMDADLRGLSSHGVAMLPLYLQALENRSVARHDQAEVIIDAGAMIRLDAKHALGQLTSLQATDLAIERARRHGIAMVGVCQGHHFGAASTWALRLAEAGMVGIALSNSAPLMAAPGGKKPVVGNNPIAIAVLDRNGRALVADLALSAGSMAKVRAAVRSREKVPEGWALDRDGVATTDPEAALLGSLAPIGGAKGFSLALLIDVMTGLLTGGLPGFRLSRLSDTTTPNNCSHLFFAIDPNLLGTYDHVLDGVADIIAAVESSGEEGRNQPRAPGQWRRELASRQRAEGIAIDANVLELLGWNTGQQH